MSYFVNDSLEFQTRQSLKITEEPISAELPQSVGNRKPKAPPSTQAFQFVNATNPTAQSKDPKTRKLIRKHVVRDSVRQKRALERSKAQVKANPLASSTTPETPLGLTPNQPNTNLDVTTRCLKHDHTLGRSLDPHLRLTRCVLYMESVSSTFFPLESKFKFNPFHWFDMELIADTALVYALLYATITYTGLLRGTAETKAAIGWLDQSVSLVNERLTKSNLDVGDGTIMAISCFAAAEAVKGNFEGWNMHMIGLAQSVKIRGGVSKLSTVTQLKIYRSDLLGSIDFLTYPHLHFHRSTESVSLRPVVTEYSQIHGDPVSVMTKAPVSPRLISIFHKMARFSRSCQSLLHSTYSRTEKIAFMEDVNEIRYEILLLKFLDLDTIETRYHLNESLRIGALIFMQETLQEFRISDLGSGNMIGKLKGLLNRIVECHGRVEAICLWLLVMGGISSRRALDRTWFVAQLTRVSIEMGLGEWEGVKEMLGCVVWIDELLDGVGQRLWEEVEVTRMVLTGKTLLSI